MLCPLSWASGTIQKYEQAPESARRKYTRLDLERFAEMAAFAVNAAAALQQVAPVPVEAVNKQWLEPFGEGGVVIAAEISAHLAAKDQKLTVRGVKQLRELRLPQFS